MPFRDGTGPLGLGPMTGKGEGYCAIPLSGGYEAPMLGRRWFGSGYRRGYAYPIANQAFIPWIGYEWRRRRNYPEMNARVALCENLAKAVPKSQKNLNMFSKEC